MIFAMTILSSAVMVWVFARLVFTMILGGLCLAVLLLDRLLAGRRSSMTPGADLAGLRRLA